MSCRVGILTFHHVNNYGSVFQAWGLAKACQALGSPTKIIDYRPRAAVKYYNLFGLRSGLFFRIMAKRWRFHHFRKLHLPVTEKTYLTPESLADVEPDFDVLITGSDQVWRQGGFRGFDPPFFLDFGDNCTSRRVSYAASFGATTNLGNRERPIAELLERFDLLSVRDEQSRALVKKICGRDAEIVMDPTFLCEFDHLAKAPSISQDYLAVYCLERTPDFERTVDFISKKFRLPIVGLGIRFRGADVHADNIGPAEWLGWMQNATFVCTNSFHGVVFSIKMKKNFVAPARTEHQNRIDDLLQRIGLTERIVKNTTRPASTNVVLHDVDYAEPQRLIELHIQRSWDFLKRALAN